MGAARRGLRWSSLARVFPRARFVQALDGQPLARTDLAIGVFDFADRRARRAFVAASRAAGAAALCVALHRGEVLVGPVTQPRRAGCAVCAWDRLIAAAAGTPGDRFVGVPAGEGWRLAGRVLRDELRAIRRWGAGRSRLVDHVLSVRVETRDQALHRFIPLSHCDVCGGAAAARPRRRSPMRLAADDDPEVVLGALDGWIDGRSGVVSGIFLEPPGDMPAGLPFVVTAAPPHVVDGDGVPRGLPIGWGKGLTVSGAVLSAVGEAIERYAASLPDPARIAWELPSALRGDVLDPRSCALYTEAQYATPGFPYLPFDPAIRHPWVLGRWLGDGTPVWVPAVLAFLALTVAPEHLICQGTSNGLAAAFDPDDAATRATLELIERDALMSAWLTGRRGHRIRLDDTLDPRLRSVLEGIEALGAGVEVYRLPTSACGVTILCLAFGDGDRYPGVTIGLGTALDAGTALRQAVLELGQTGPHLRRLMRSRVLTAPSRPAGVVNMLDHATYYFPPGRAAAFDRLRSRHASVTLRALAGGDITTRPVRSTARGDLGTALAAAGIRVAVVDVTSADVRLGPFHVVRAVSPDLQPISYGYGLDRTPVERLQRRRLAPGVPPIHPIW